MLTILYILFLFYFFIDVYTERDVRIHITRLRDLLGGPYKPNPSAIGIDSSISFLTAVTGEIGKVIKNKKKRNSDLIFLRNIYIICILFWCVLNIYILFYFLFTYMNR